MAIRLALIPGTRAQWNNILAVPLIRWCSITSILAIVLSLVCIAWWLRMLPQSVPLWYSRAWGQDQLASPFWLFLLPGAGLLWQGCSLTLASRIAEYSVFAKLTVVAATLVNVLSFIAIIQILMLVL